MIDPLIIQIFDSSPKDLSKLAQSYTLQQINDVVVLIDKESVEAYNHSFGEVARKLQAKRKVFEKQAKQLFKESMK